MCVHMCYMIWRSMSWNSLPLSNSALEFRTTWQYLFIIKMISEECLCFIIMKSFVI